MDHEYVGRIVDLIDPSTNQIFGQTVEDARRSIESLELELSIITSEERSSGYRAASSNPALPPMLWPTATGFTNPS